MMNVLALSLVLTTLVTAGVFSPSPEKKNQKDDVIVKEGHRTAVVEYENDDRSNTRVFISPQEAQRNLKSAEVDGKTHASGIKDKGEDANEKLKEVASEHLPNLGEGISASEKDKDSHGHSLSPRELVCDAYGKCKHKIASALGRTKDKVYEKANEAAEKIYEVEEEVKENVKEAVDKVKDTVREKSYGVSERAHETMERVKDGAGEISGKAKEAKEVVKEGARERAEKVKRSAAEAVDTGKTLKGDVEKNASRKMESTKKKVSEKAKEAEEMWEHASEEVKDGAHKLKEEGKKDLKEILQRGGEVFFDAFSYVVSPERMAASIGILQLLGISTAFGMSIWVTLISSYVLARALPRQQFAMVQSKIYPVYFKAMAYSIGAVLMGHLLSQRKRLSSGTQETSQGFNLLASLIMDVVNLLILEPRATKVVFERMKLEKEEGRGKESSTTTEPSARIIDSMTEPAVTRAAAGAGAPLTTTATATPAAVRTEERPKDTASRAELVRLSKTLKKLNSVSSFLNVLTLMALTWHLVHLGQTLHSVSQC